MRNAAVVMAAVGLVAAAGLTACTNGNAGGTDGNGGGANAGASQAKIGIILPDTTSAQRWNDDDPRYLKQTFDAADVAVDIQNAQGSKARFAQIADRMIKGGVKVLMIVNLDSASGAAVLAKARSAGVKTIDYDRLTLGGGADYYVSFDNERVGELQGYGMVKCLTARNPKDPVVAELNGSPDDHNATLFKQGYDSVLQERYDTAEYTKGPDQWTPDWSTDQARDIFSQMLGQRPDIGGVVAANDALASTVIDVLRKRQLNGKVVVTGQDATIQGLQNILLGDQCMTVYKPVEPEAQAAANLAISLFRGQPMPVLGRIKDPESGKYLPYMTLQPRAIDSKSIKGLVDDGFVTLDELCGGSFAALCRKYEIE